jgi:hypothetical protein
VGAVGRAARTRRSSTIECDRDSDPWVRSIALTKSKATNQKDRPATSTLGTRLPGIMPIAKTGRRRGVRKRSVASILTATIATMGSAGETLPAEAAVTWLDVAYGQLRGVAHSSPSGGRRRGEVGGTQNCTLVRSVCLSALEATWTSAPDLVESDASAETATSNGTIVNGAFTVALTPPLSRNFIGPLPTARRPCLLTCSCSCAVRTPSIMCDEVLQARAHVPLQSLATLWVRLHPRRAAAVPRLYLFRNSFACSRKTSTCWDCAPWLASGYMMS